MNGNVPDAIGATVNPWSLVRSKLLLIMVPVAVLAITLLLGLAIWPSLRGEPTIIETQVIAMGDAALAAELNQVTQMESANDALDEAVLWRVLMSSAGLMAFLGARVWMRCG